MLTSISLELWYLMHTKLGACGTFFGLPPWNQYINGGACDEPELNTPQELFNAAPLIGLALLDILLRIAGVAAVFFIIYGGIQYITSQGGDGVKNGQATIINALVGLIIAMISVAFVSFLGRSLGAN